MSVVLLLGVVIICWSLKSFLKKKGLQKFSALEFYCIEYFFYLIPIIIYLIYLYKQTNFTFIKKINKEDVNYFLLTIFIGTIGGLVFIHLLKNENVTYLISSILPGEIVLTLILGYFLFKENINIYQLFGIFLVLAGITCINKK
tara:strand:- start:274 stop:705 length:432 start_codon:yes stop_codon:yes gene_type:complete